MGRLVRLAALAIAMALILCGCEYSFFSPEAAMRAPRATGEAQRIQEALEESVGADIVLKYPRTGKVRSAFLAHDVDGDGLEEMFVFYQKRTESGITRIHLLRQQEGQWITVQDLTPVGTSLNTVEFADLNGDGVDEILTGWGTSNSNENLLCIYQFEMEHQRLIQRAAEKCTEYFVYDFNHTGKCEVGILHLNSTLGSALMTVLDFTNTMAIVGTVQLDGSITGYLKVQVARLDNGNAAIYIDAYRGPNTTVTEVVIYNGREFRNLYLDPVTNNTILTQRPWVARVQDINEDGRLDIPFCVALPYDVLSGYSQQYLTRWQTYNGDSYTVVLNAWYCFDDHYYLTFDRRWETEVTVLYDEQKHEAIFCEWNLSSGTAGEELLRIQMVNTQEWEGMAEQGYAAITQTDSVVYAAKISDSTSKNAITARQLLDSFHLVLTT